jgi:hypothetical protein
MQYIKKILRGLGIFIYKIFALLRLVRSTVIVLVDGGICSQMYQYLIGYYLKMKNNYPIEYNIVWYDVDGHDANGNSVRNFDLLKAFPDLDFPVASARKCRWYNRLFPYYAYSSTEWDKPWYDCRPPVTLLGYFKSPSEMWKPFHDLFKIDAHRVLDTENLAIYENIPHDSSVAVHVRRGDLSTYRTGYGSPVTEDYFSQAIKYFYDINPQMTFYFFSDDKDYVQQVLIPSLPFEIKSVISNNGDENGYMDLFLISRCRYQITSKGSLGKYGALLSDNNNKLVIVSKDDTGIDMLKCVDNINIMRI